MLSKNILIACYCSLFLLAFVLVSLPAVRAQVQPHRMAKMSAKPHTKLPSEPAAKPSAFLSVSNLAPGTLTDELSQLFATIGEVRQVRFQRIGSASVEMATSELAAKALAKLNRSQFRGHLIRVQFLPQNRLIRPAGFRSNLRSKPSANSTINSPKSSLIQSKTQHEPISKRRKLMYPTEQPSAEKAQ